MPLAPDTCDRRARLGRIDGERLLAEHRLARVEGEVRLREVLSHFVFALQRALGPATVDKSLVCYPGDGIGAEDGIAAELRAGGVPVKVAGNVGGEAADFNRIVLTGEQGTVEFRDWLATRDGQLVQTAGRAAYLCQLDQLVAFVEGKPNSLPDFGEALSVQETIETMLAPERAAQPSTSRASG